MCRHNTTSPLTCSSQVRGEVGSWRHISELRVFRFQQSKHDRMKFETLPCLVSYYPYSHIRQRMYCPKESGKVRTQLIMQIPGQWSMCYLKKKQTKQTNITSIDTWRYLTTYNNNFVNLPMTMNSIHQTANAHHDILWMHTLCLETAYTQHWWNGSSPQQHQSQSQD
jgi:hypothetical protein